MELRSVRSRYLKDNEQNPYWQRCLNGSDSEFMSGYDSLMNEAAGSMMDSILDEIEENDKREAVEESFKKLIQMMESERNHIVTAMIDDMDEEEYDICKAKATAEADEIEAVLAKLMVFIRDKAAAVEGVKEGVPDLSLVYGYENLENGLIAEYKDNKIYVAMEEGVYFLARNILITYAHICLNGDPENVEQVKKANYWAGEQLDAFWKELENE